MQIHATIVRVLDFLSRKGFEIKLAWRYSSDSWNYDGETIALMKHDEGQDEDGYKYPKVIYSEHDILHEICHWLVASNEQRLFPEFALAIGIQDSFALGTIKDGVRNKDGITNEARNVNVFDGFLELQEQDLQEFAAQKLCIFLGEMFKVNPNLSDWKGSWDDYSKFKNDAIVEYPKDFIQKVNERVNQIKVLLQN